MAEQVVHLQVELTIHDGDFEAFERVAQEMIAGTRAEPGALGYEWYLSSDGKRCVIYESYRDAGALLAHINGPVVQQGVPKLLQHSALTRCRVFGDPGAEARAILTEFGAEIFDGWRSLSTK